MVPQPGQATFNRTQYNETLPDLNYQKDKQNTTLSQGWGFLLCSTRHLEGNHLLYILFIVQTGIPGEGVCDIAHALVLAGNSTSQEYNN